MSDAGWPDDEVFFRVREVDIACEDGEHPLVLAHGEEIARNWELEKAANPALFNGRMLLSRGLTLTPDGRLSGVAHFVPFAAFLWWRKQSPRPAIADHLFPVAIPMTSDGAVLAIRMGDHTANAGRVYCAAGSLDANDVDGGKVDLESNIRRELVEETGIALSPAASRGYTGVRIGRVVTLFRLCDLGIDAQEASRRIYAHMEADHEKEIAGPVIIRDANLDAHDYAPFMRPILKLIFDAKSFQIGA